MYLEREVDDQTSFPTEFKEQNDDDLDRMILGELLKLNNGERPSLQ